jgi:hypothetical protein
MQDRSTSQASNSCADNTDMRWAVLGSTISADGGSAGSIENGICNVRAARYLLFISGSHAKVFLCVFLGTGIPGSTTRRLSDATDRKKRDNLKGQFPSNQ